VIVLAYGKLASCVALTSFIESSEQLIAKVREDVNADRDPNWFTALIGTPAMRSIGSVVVIPSFHPGRIAYAGPLAPYLIEAFFLVHQIAWFAIDVAMNCNKSLPQNAVCEKVLREVKRILKPEHDFGERFSQSSENLKLIKHAFMEDDNPVLANPGDMLWLLKRFLPNLCGTHGVSFNLKPASKHEDSIFLRMTRFCSHATYRYHPYWRTLLALAHPSDTDKTARLFASNVVVIALETLAIYSHKPGTLPYTIANGKAFYDNMMSLQRNPKLAKFSEAHIQEDPSDAKQSGDDTIVISSGGEED
jgi:hypothetical protein